MTIDLEPFEEVCLQSAYAIATNRVPLAFLWDPRCHLRLKLSPIARGQSETAPGEPRVYFVRCGEFVKVGYTTRLSHRMSTLRMATPYPLTLLSTIRGAEISERYLHEVLKRDKHRGEWFRLTPRTIEILLAFGADDRTFAKCGEVA